MHGIQRERKRDTIGGTRVQLRGARARSCAPVVRIVCLMRGGERERKRIRGGFVWVIWSGSVFARADMIRFLLEERAVGKARSVL